MNRLHRTAVPVCLLLLLLLASCSAEPTVAGPEAGERTVVVVSPPDPDAPRHTHETLIGDGTSPEAGGYRMSDLEFPESTGKPGRLTFGIIGPDGEPVLDFTEEQTELLHLYVVDDDLTVFRHLHPDLDSDGTWSAYVDLAEAGDYRVVAEFVPSDRPGGSHLVLATSVTVPGEAPAVREEPAGRPDAEASRGPEDLSGRVVADDGIVTVTGPAALAVGPDEQIELTFSDGDAGVLNLGTYLGSYAHLTGFDEETGAFVHVHPLGAPTTTEQGSVLRFHTSFATAGTYRFFVQVRVDGFVHTVPLTMTVV